MTENEVAELGPKTRVDPAVEIRVATVGRIVRWVAVIYSLLVLLGVLIEPVGEALSSGPVHVRPISGSSAVALATMAFGALFAGDTRRTVDSSVAWRRVGVVLSTFSGVFGILVMLFYLVGIEDNWNGRFGTVPAFVVGVVLTALALAIPLLVSRKEGRVITGQIFSLLVFSLSAVIFLGYAFGDPSLGRMFRRPEISFQAAVMALLISVGITLIRPASGLLSTASSPGAGGRALRRFGPVVLLAPAVLLLLAESLPAGDRVDAVAFVAVSFGLLLLILLGVLVRVIDVTAVEAATSGAQAERAKVGLTQEAPLAANLSDVLHLVEISEVDGWEVVTRFRPGHGVVAGDTSIVRTLPDGTMGVVLVDVTGHGAEPALRAIRIRDLLFHSLALGQGPSEALAFLGWAAPDDVLASAVILKVDPATGEAALASAGHPPAIHIGTQNAELVKPPGPLLYLNRDSIYESTEFQVSPGDTVVLFSDGVADVQRTRDGLPEPDALADMLLAEGGVAERSADLVIGFGEADPTDDQSVVVVFRSPG